jgi:hypothetical protein
LFDLPLVLDKLQAFVPCDATSNACFEAW